MSSIPTKFERRGRREVAKHRPLVESNGRGCTRCGRIAPKPVAQARPSRVLHRRSSLYVRRRRILQLHLLLFPGDKHGAADSLELLSGSCRYVFSVPRMPAPASRCNRTNRRWRLDSFPAIAGGGVCDRERGDTPPPGKWVLLSRGLRKIPAIGGHGIPVLVPHSLLFTLQSLVPRFFAPLVEISYPCCTALCSSQHQPFDRLEIRADRNLKTIQQLMM